MFLPLFSVFFQDLQKGVGDLAEGVLDTVGAVAKAAPEALEKGGQVINGIIQAKKESRPFVEEVSKEERFLFYFR